jgi:glycosyltransferase involved in cell wall biosynthesis
MKDKVLLVGWNDPGGADIVVENLRTEFENKGIETHIVKHSLGNPRPVLHTSNSTYEFADFDDFLRRHGVDDYFAVHNHATTITPGQISALKNEVVMPYIYTVHSLGIHDAVRSPINQNTTSTLDRMGHEERRSYIWKQLERIEDEAKAGSGEVNNSRILLNQRHQMDNADHIVNMTDFGHDILGYYYPEYTNKGVIIPNGSDFHKYYNDPEVEETTIKLRHELGRSKVITFVGRVTEDKGAKVAGRAFNIVKGQMPDVKFVYVGGGDGARELIDDVIDSRYRRDVHFTGWIPTDEKGRKFIAAENKVSDVVVLPSYFESFGLTPLEAMMMGTPSIVSSVDGPKTEFVDHKLAYGSAVGNAEDVADRILYVLSNPDTAKRNAERVRKVVTDKYSLDKVSEATLMLYVATMMEKAGGYTTQNDPRFYQRLTDPTTPEEMLASSFVLDHLGSITHRDSYRELANERRQHI